MASPDPSRHPRFQFGWHGSRFRVCDQQHVCGHTTGIVGVVEGWETAYDRVDEMNAGHYGDERYTGWQRAGMPEAEAVKEEVPVSEVACPGCGKEPATTSPLPDGWAWDCKTDETNNWAWCPTCGNFKERPQ